MTSRQCEHTDGKQGGAPVLFLGIDGVLSSARYMTALGKSDYRDPRDLLFDPEAVEALGDILDRTGAEIVVSSEWRMPLGLVGLRAMWADRRLPGRVADVTPVTSACRGWEIHDWLCSNRPQGFERYCILDDDSDMLLWQAGRFVKTGGETGLLKSQVPLVVETLKGEGPPSVFQHHRTYLRRRSKTKSCFAMGAGGDWWIVFGDDRPNQYVGASHELPEYAQRELHELRNREHRPVKKK